MTLNTSTRAQDQTSPSSFKSPSFWKREKRHWLLAIAFACLVFWWCGSQMLEVSLVKKAVDLLPAIGGACFAADSIIKLTQ